MTTNDKLIKLITEKITTDYKEDIALLIRYDINSEEKESKGLDLYYIPKTEKAMQLSSQYIIDGIGYDLFPMKWDRLVSVAAMDSPQAYLFKNAEVLYVGDEEALSRFYQLKNSLETILNGRYGEALLNKAYEYLNESYIYLYNVHNLCQSSIDIRIEASKLLKQISNIIAFINHDYFLGGNGSEVSIIRASSKMKKIPKDYPSLVDTIIHHDDMDLVKTSLNELVNNTRTLLQSIRESYAQTEPFETFFNGYYEEMQKYLNYFKEAILSGDSYKQFEIASYLHEEISQFLTKSKDGIWYDDRNVYHEYSIHFESLFELDFMKLIAHKNTDLLLTTLENFDNTFKGLLKKENIQVNSFDGFDSFSDYFRNK
ncbi:MAG: hypothetical protein JEZ08_13400 [Clostridiales bacterium]|nr:hypothetical protein [Clostridiales bacterium]